jgi:2-hydroxychromene-2-carboxylate isomerase
MVMAAAGRGMDAMRLSHALLTALWLEDRDIADPRTRIAIAEEQGMPGESLHREEESASIQAEFDRNNRDAIARGVFGAPTYICEELFVWGQDRLFFLDKYLAGEAVQSGPVKTIAKTRAR